MGLWWTHRQELNMKFTYTTKQKWRLMQVGNMRCDGLNKDNFELKLYMTHNLWKGGTTPFLIIYILWLSTRVTSKWHFLLGFLLSKNFVHLCLFQVKHVLSMQNKFHNLQKDLSNGIWYISIEINITLTLKRFVVRNQILNLTPKFSFDYNSCILGLNK